MILVCLLFTSCEERYSNVKYDVTFNVVNKSSLTIKLDIVEINQNKFWRDNELEPEDSFEVSFNIKKDIDEAESGFLIKAFKPCGDSIVLNTGYFTNYQIQGKASQYYIISDNKIDLQN